MAISFTKLTRAGMRALQPGERINQHGITFERRETETARLPSTLWLTANAFIAASDVNLTA